MDKINQLYAGFCNTYKIKFDIKDNLVIPLHKCLLPLSEDDEKAFLQSERDFTMAMFGAFDWISHNDDSDNESIYCSYICIFQIYGKVSFYTAIRVTLTSGEFKTTFVIYKDYNKILKFIRFPNGEVSLFDMEWSKKQLNSIQKAFDKYVNSHKYIRANFAYDRYEDNCYYQGKNAIMVLTNNYKTFIKANGNIVAKDGIIFV